MRPLLYSLFCILLFSQASNASWVKQAVHQIGGSSKSLISAIDSEDNIIYSGKFNGKLKFDNLEIEEVKSSNCYLTKISTSGETDWLLHFKSDSADSNVRIIGITTDENDDIFITGEYKQSITLNTTTFASPLTNDTEGFLMKLSKDGQHLWTKTFSGLGINKGTTILWYKQKLYLGANFTTSFQYQNITIKTSHYLAKTNQNAAILCLSEEGDYIWSKVINSERSAILKLAATTNNLYAFCTAKEQPYITGPQGEEVFPMNYSLGSTDAYLLCLDITNGKGQWCNQIGSTKLDNILDMYLTGNTIYCTGQFKSDLKCKSQDGNLQKLTSVGTKLTSFLCSYNTDGNINWATKIGLNTTTGVFSMTQSSTDLLIALFFVDSITIGSKKFTNTNDGIDNVIAAINTSTGAIRPIYHTTTTPNNANNPATSFITSIYVSANNQLLFNGYSKGKLTLAGLSTNSITDDYAVITGMINSPLSTDKFNSRESSSFAYPNPASSKLNIINSAQNCTVKMYNLYGELIHTYKSPTEINISHMASGAYLLEMQSDKRSIIQHLIITH